MQTSAAHTVSRAFAALLLSACTIAATSTEQPPLAQRYNAFGFDLFGKTMAADRGTNVILSPTSIALALAMAQNGAAGKTRAAIAKTLHANDLSEAALNAGNAALLHGLLASHKDVQFSIADSLWIENGFRIHPEFERSVQHSYDAKIANIPFDEAGLSQLNGWVRDRTLGLIPKVLDRFEPLDRAVLANVLALKAKWSQPFDPHETAPAPFHREDGAARTVSMMRQSAELEYAKGADWQLVALPYHGNRFAMYLFLPASHSAPEFSNAAFDRARTAMHPTDLTLEVPRFTARFSVELNGPLTQLGMGIAFDPDAADFSRMTSSAVRISRVHHVTYVRVDEAGTEAAAATAVVIGLTAVRQPPERMIVDHPFYFILRDEQSQQILFLGHIISP